MNTFSYYLPFQSTEDSPVTDCFSDLMTLPTLFMENCKMLLFIDRLYIVVIVHT